MALNTIFSSLNLKWESQFDFHGFCMNFFGGILGTVWESQFFYLICFLSCDLYYLICGERGARAHTE